jgi:hypothetical protein
MSTYAKFTKHPITGRFEPATWLDDYYGRHRYGVVFEDSIFEADKHKWETRDAETEEEQLIIRKCLFKTLEDKNII